jgi:putative ABC transport system substrate-binding protein
MRRREFVAGIATSTVWPLTAQAQRPSLPVIGFLNGSSPATWAPFAGAFRRGLKEAGYIEDQNVAIEYRWAEAQAASLPKLARELADRQPAVIVAAGGDQAILTARNANTTAPLLFITGSDPVKLGLVASLNRPGGNLTGVTHFTSALEPKRFELLREAVPTAAVIALLVNPDYPSYQIQIVEVQSAARAVGQTIVVVNATTEETIGAGVDEIVKQRGDALLVGSDPFFTSQREKLVALAGRHKLPAIYQWREFAAIGGLMSYGTDLAEAYRLLGGYAGRILKGARPEELPVQQLTKVDLVLNLKTAKSLGLTLPISLLGRADEIIE